MFYFQKRNVFSSGEQISTFQIYSVSQENITFFEVFRPPSENVQREELITSSSAVEGLRRGRGPRARWRASCVEEGTVEGHKHTRWRPHEEEEGGGVTEGERTATRGRRGRRCSTRKKRSGSICARRWRLYTREIYSRCQPPAGSKGPLLPVRVTNRE